MSAGLQQIRGKRLFVEDTEDGQPVVLVHGLGGTTSFYEPLVPALTEHFRVVRYDFDGHGRSPLTGPISLPELAEDLAALIESIGAGRAHVVGHSMGTLVVQQLAVTRPDLVDALVLLGPVRAQPEPAKQATRARAATVREQGMSAVADTIAGAATSPTARANNPLVAGVVRELLLGQTREGYAQACEALAAAESPDLGAIAAPVLLLTGTEDKVSPPATSEAMAAELKDATTASTADCGHWTVTEAPAFVAEQTLAFLRR
jgi:pimeloyl-ACP methyl ester carboxylesterase